MAVTNSTTTTTTNITVEIAFGSIAFVLGTAIVTANGLIVLAVFRFQYLRTRANLYIVSLASTDILVGLYQFMLGATYIPSTSPTFDNSRTACVLIYSWAYCTVVCSGFNMCLIAFDRYFFFAKPFLYERVVTETRVKVAICITWCAAILYGSSLWYVNTFTTEGGCRLFTVVPRVYRSYSTTFIFLFCCLVTCVVYSAIARMTYKHLKQISKTQVSLVTSRSTETSIPHSHLSPQSTHLPITKAELTTKNNQQTNPSIAKSHLASQHGDPHTQNNQSAIELTDMTVQNSYPSTDHSVPKTHTSDQKTDSCTTDTHQPMQKTRPSAQNTHPCVQNTHGSTQNILSSSQNSHPITPNTHSSSQKPAAARSLSTSPGRKSSLPTATPTPAASNGASTFPRRRSSLTTATPAPATANGVSTFPRRKSSLTTATSTSAIANAVSTFPRRRSSLKALKLFITVFGILLACWLPYMVMEVMSIFRQVNNWLYFGTLFLGFLNSGMNVFVYPVFNPRFRVALKHMLTSGCATKTTRVVPLESTLS